MAKDRPQHGADVHFRPGVDDEVAAGDEVVEVVDGGVAADEGLGLIEVRGGAAVAVGEGDGLLVVERGEAAALDLLEEGFELLPLRPALFDERGKVHGVRGTQYPVPSTEYPVLGT